MKIARQATAEKLSEYLQGELTQAELVDWAERANPSYAVEISRCRTRFTRCAISASGMRSRWMRGIAQRP